MKRTGIKRADQRQTKASSSPLYRHLNAAKSSRGHEQMSTLKSISKKTAVDKWTEMLPSEKNRVEALKETTEGPLW